MTRKSLCLLTALSMLLLAPAWSAHAMPQSLTGKGFAVSPSGRMNLSPGLTATFTRNTATRDYAGNTVAVNTPRYGPPQLLLPSLPNIEGEFSPGVNATLFQPGYAADGSTPIWIVYTAGFATMNLWSGAGNFGPGNGSNFDINLQAGTASAGRTAAIVDALRTAGAGTDLFKQQITQTNYVNECWSPVTGAVIYGQAAVLCRVFYNPTAEAGTAADREDATKWLGPYVGVAFCKLSTWIASPGTGWAASPPRSGRLYTSTLGAIGAGWALDWDYLNRDGAKPTKIWVNGVDYQNHPRANGGVAFCIPLARTTTTSDDWTNDGAAQTFTIAAPFASDVRHVHSSLLNRSGTTDIIQTITTGDGQQNQAVIVLKMTGEGSTTAHDTAYRAGGTVASDARAWYTGTLTNWTTVAATGTGAGIDNGSLGAAGSVTNGTNSAASWPGNQFVGCGYDGYGIAGSDETADAICRWTIGDPGTPIVFTPTWAPRRVRLLPPNGTPANLTALWDCFFIAEISKIQNGRGWTTLMGPGTNYPAQAAGMRTIYTPDGTHAGAMGANGSSPDYPLYHLDGRVYFNSAINSISSLAVPTTYRIVRHLQLAPGAVNYRNASWTVADNTGGQATITDATSSPPAGCPAVPSTAYVARIVHPGTTTANIADFRIADTIPITTKEAIIKGWLYNTPPSSRGDGVSASLSVGFTVVLAKQSDGSGAVTSGNLLAEPHPAHGVWIPFTIRVPVQAMISLADSTIRATLRLAMSNGTACPADFYIAIDSVTACNPTTGADASTYPVAAGATGADEACTVSGFDVPFTGPWSFAATFQVPVDPAWDEGHAMVYYSTAAVNVDSTHTTLTSGPSTDIITNGLLRVGTSANSGKDGVSITAYDTGTKVATHGALTGISAGVVTAAVHKPLYDTTASINRPRQLFALLTQDEQNGLAVFLLTARSWSTDADGHSFGIARITAGAIDWTTYTENDSSLSWVMVGDKVDIAISSSSLDSIFTVGGAEAGRPISGLSDFGALWGTFTTERLTKIKVGGFSGGPTPMEFANAWLEPAAYVDADFNARFQDLGFFNAVPEEDIVRNRSSTNRNRTRPRRKLNRTRSKGHVPCFV